MERVSAFLLFLSAYCLTLAGLVEVGYLKRVLSDLMPKYETINDAVYTHFRE